MSDVRITEYSQLKVGSWYRVFAHGGEYYLKIIAFLPPDPPHTLERGFEYWCYGVESDLSSRTSHREYVLKIWNMIEWTPPDLPKCACGENVTPGWDHCDLC